VKWLREAVRSVSSRRVSFLGQVVLFAGMVTALVLVTLQNEGERARLTKEFERAGTIRVEVSAQDERAGLDWRLATVLSRVSAVQSEIAFRNATDVRPIAVAMVASPVSFRSLAVLGRTNNRDAAWLDQLRPDRPLMGTRAATAFGAEGGLTRVQESSGAVLATYGLLLVPAPFASLNGEVVMRESASEAALGTYARISVIVRNPSELRSVQHLVESLLAERPPGSVGVAIPTDLLELERQLTTTGSSAARRLVVGALLGLGILVGIGNTIVLGTRRRELGRRRALGATRSTIVMLLVAESVVVSLIGTAVASVVLGVMAVTVNTASPRWAVGLDAAWLSVVAAAIGSVAPALRAVLVDPVEALRIP